MMIDDNDDGYDYHDGYDKFFFVIIPLFKVNPEEASTRGQS